MKLKEEYHKICQDQTRNSAVRIIDSKDQSFDSAEEQKEVSSIPEPQSRDDDPYSTYENEKVQRLKKWNEKMGRK